MGLKTTLARYVRPVQLGETTPATLDAGARERLATDLRGISSRNALYFGLCVAVVLALLTGAAAFVIANRADLGRIQAGFAVTGVSIMGLMAQMVALWKQKVAADLLVTLCGTLNPSSLQAVVEILLARLG